MKTFTIRSAVELLQELKLPNGIWMYRGQGNGAEPLLPSIARMNDVVKSYEDWNVLQDDLLHMFQQRSLPYLDPTPTNSLQWLIIAQHHGLPTCLLDWTTNPLKALFFAVENPADDINGAVWAFEPAGYFNDLTRIIEIKKGRLDFIASYFPPHIDPLVIAQESCFTFFPLPDTIKPIPPLENTKYYKKEVSDIIKFVIPRENKMMCRHELRNLGISHSSLFPNLNGVATAIRRELDLSW